MFDRTERAYLERARVARLATADADGRPHAVPICFGLVDSTLVTPIDEKPKARPPGALRRVRDVRENPAVTVLVDHYRDDWAELGWLQVRGTATMVDPDAGDPGVPIDREAAIETLRDKYDQYASHDLAARPILAVSPGSVSSWGRIDPETAP